MKRRTPARVVADWAYDRTRVVFNWAFLILAVYVALLPRPVPDPERLRWWEHVLIGAAVWTAVVLVAVVVGGDPR